MATQPQVSFRSSVSPFNVISSISYIQTTPGGTTLPVLQGNDSDSLYFRVYNNFGCVAGVADMLNVSIGCYDGVGIHTASMPVASQKWIHVLENGYGQSVAAPGVYSYLQGTDTPIGGSTTYFPDTGSDGSVVNNIKAGPANNGCGFIEVKSYARVPAEASQSTQSFVISVLYDWTT